MKSSAATEKPPSVRAPGSWVSAGVLGLFTLPLWPRPREFRLAVLGPAWWSTAAMLAVMVLMVSPFWPDAPRTVDDIAALVIPVGLIWATASVIAAETYRRRASGHVQSAIRAQPFSGAAVLGVGLACSALAAQLRTGSPEVDSQTVRAIWVYGGSVVVLASLQLVTSTRRLLLDGLAANQRLLLSEREANAAELMALQQQLDPGLLMNVLSKLTSRVDVAPGDVERAVERLAIYLRENLRTSPAPNATVADEVRRASDYIDIMRLAGVTIPITWHINADASHIRIPTGALRIFLDYALGRCQRDAERAPKISVQALIHRSRFYLIVTDTATPDPPALAEPESLAALRRRLGAPPQRRVRVETHVMLEVDSPASGTTQTLSMNVDEAA